MPSVSQIRASDLINISTPIVEPLNAPDNLSKVLSRFADNYKLTPNSHLYRLLSSLCGDAGVGSVRKEVLIPLLQQRLEATHFTMLDQLYGAVLGLARTTDELYTYDPTSQMLTNDQWAEVRAKDSSYRHRCLVWAKALLEGPTPRGIGWAVEAAIGIECDLVEQYKYLENQASDAPLTVTNYGKTSSRSEFVLLPRTPTLTQAEQRAIIRSVDRLRPVNTVPTTTAGYLLRTSVPSRAVAASTENFYIKRFVTGNPAVSWPAIDATKNMWISTTEAEAPTFAFGTTQESVTYLTITGATATSEHIGSFNKTQQGLFMHLASVPGSFYTFDVNRSYAKNIAPTNVTTPWLSQEIVVNKFYPVEYFTAENTSSFVVNPVGEFWASDEKLAPATDQIVYDLGRSRPMNFIDFEICLKPIDIKLEYSTDNVTWTEATPDPDFDPSFSVAYLPSTEVSWHYFECHFDLVQARYFRLTFTRRTDSFPLPTSDAFAFSIEVRNLRLMHIMTAASDFVADNGTDILGNYYRTDKSTNSATNVTDGNDLTFWQSQPNPTSEAVESLYFDLRNTSQTGTMTIHDALRMSDDDPKSMADMETYYEDGVVIDEIYLNPVTTGVGMHIYYSLDDEPDWDNKLWIPIPRHYVTRRGFHALPLPTLVKYLKLEFSNLAALPYEPIDYPDLKPVIYNKYPSWVQDYFNGIYLSKPYDGSIVQAERVDIDPLSFGFQRVVDVLNQTYSDERTPSPDTTNSEVQTYIETLLNTQATDKTSATSVEDNIRFNASIMWQDDLINQLDPTRALSRKAQELRSNIVDTGFNSEGALPTSTPPLLTTTDNPTAVYAEKTRPVMFFPRKCRHGYQVVKAQRDKKVAYVVGIIDVEFYRRDYTALNDEAIYVETLDDTSHIAANELTLSDWRYVPGV